MDKIRVAIIVRGTRAPAATALRLLYPWGNDHCRSGKVGWSQ